MKLPFLINNNPQQEPDPSVKRVFIRRNRWDNYGAFVGSKKVRDDGNKWDLIVAISKLYPNAEILDHTL